MKGWLNKPPVVAALALIACGFVYYNVVRPMLGSSPTIGSSFEDPSMMLLGQSDVENASSKIIGQSADWQRLSQINISSASKRDLFSPYVPSNIRVPIPRSHALHRVHHHASPSRTKPTFSRVQAIIFGSGMKYAVIGDKIVQEGGHIKGYTVIKIRENTIMLRGSAGVVTLEFVKQDEG